MALLIEQQHRSDVVAVASRQPATRLAIARFVVDRGRRPRKATDESRWVAERKQGGIISTRTRPDIQAGVGGSDPLAQKLIQAEGAGALAEAVGGA